MFIIPYLVLAAVALLFSFICYMMFFGVPGRKKTADHREIAVSYTHLTLPTKLEV